MTEGFDLEAFRASQTEASDDVFDVRLGVHKDDEGNPVDDFLHFPPLRRWPIEAQTKFAEGNIVDGIRLLAGDEGAELFGSYHWTFGEFEALFEALAKWSGFAQGQTSVPRPTLGPTRT